METTTQRKIWGGILGVALLALGADRAQTASKAVSGSVAAGSKGPVAVGTTLTRPNDRTAKTPTTPVPQAPPAPSLAARLSGVARAEAISGDSVPDAFTPSDRWAPPAAVAAAPPLPNPVIPLVDRAAEFRGRHHLTAVMSSRSGAMTRGLAMVDGKTLVPGQSIDGFTLSGVKERSALFTSGTASVELRLAPPSIASLTDH